jgi:hypothetical protein
MRNALRTIQPAAGGRSIMRLNQPEEDDSKQQPGDDEERVITPAGPLPKSKVHQVKPGEVVRRNPDGTISIVPKERPEGDEESGSCQTSSY